MSWCAVYGCHNNSKRDTEKTYFGLPKDETSRKEWIKLINRTKLPSKVFVCSDHFDEACFDDSWALQTRLFYTNHPVKRKLVPGSKPTTFPHKSQPKERQTSKKRAHKRQVVEVRYSLLICVRLR